MINFMAVSPHGDELIDPKDPESKKLNEAMKRLAIVKSSYDLDTLVVLTPHNIRIPDYFAVITCQYLKGEMGGHEIQLETDRQLGYSLLNEVKKSQLPAVGVNFGALEGDLSSLPLDWGTSIPLNFLYKGEKVLLIGPAREIKREILTRFGEVLASVIDRAQERVGIIISADNAHTHEPGGPYGYSPMAALYDNEIVEAFKGGELSRISYISDQVIEGAKPDSFWQFMVMLGIINYKPMKPVYLYYAHPTYFGMLVAYFKNA
ncbi:MAG: extradiol dioxygenase [Thermoprotei archaeon]